ncbi:ParB/RepB/Spo0J family partition protein [Tundrisphaera sp. TA3]|uniref:ParB/RepB/Spo0J family partition protein n=1 Tax=Tundrisphaera sp. TA3 TaxID=3435775 RepID=UPI003EB99FA4
MSLHQIEINRLCKSPSNVRKTNPKAAQEELKASILAHGLMQNLVVTDAGDGSYHVIAGARRLEALQELVAEGKLKGGTIPCQIVTEGDAVEMSLAENTVRQAMHPADEFEAFAALSDQGQTASQIAERFGKSEKHVLQRLKLGRVAPELVEEYRAENLKLEVLEAFTITDDRKKQLKVYKQAKDGWQIHHPREIRGLLTESTTKADSKLAKFVTLEAYEAAGGTTKTDLFGEDVYLEDTALLHRLTGEKLEAEAEALRADGWGWVEVTFDDDYSFTRRCGRIEAVPLDAPAELMAEQKAVEAEIEAIEREWDEADEDDDALLDAISERRNAAEARQEAIEAKLESFVDFLPLEKKLAGCFVSIGWGGKLDIEKGLVKPEDKKVVAKGQPDADADDEPEDKPGLSQALIDDLKRYRTQVAQVAFAENPAIAFDLLVFTAAKAVIGNSSIFDGPDVHFRENHLRPSVEPDTAATERLDAIREALPLAWLKEKTEPQQFAAFRKLADEDKHRLMAYCTAMTLQAKLAPGEGKQKSAYDTALGLTGVDVAGYWRPTAANFLSRIKREQLLEIGREVLIQGESWAIAMKDAKKAALVAELDAAFAKSGNPDTRDAIREWLPEGMAIAKPEPVAVKAKKGKQAA